MAHLRLLAHPVALLGHTWKIASGKTSTGRPFTVTAAMETALLGDTPGAAEQHVDVSVDLGGSEEGECIGSGKELVDTCAGCGSHEVALTGQAPNDSASVRLTVRGEPKYEAAVFNLPGSVIPRTEVYFGFIPAAHPAITRLKHSMLTVRSFTTPRAFSQLQAMPVSIAPQSQ